MCVLCCSACACVACLQVRSAQATTLEALEAAEDIVRPETGSIERVWIAEEVAVLEGIAEEECKRPATTRSNDANPLSVLTSHEVCMRNNTKPTARHGNLVGLRLAGWLCRFWRN